MVLLRIGHGCVVGLPQVKVLPSMLEELSPGTGLEESKEGHSGERGEPAVEP